MRVLSGFFCTAVVMVFAVSAGLAAEINGARAALIAQIEAGGRNQWKDERRAVKVDGCTLITYRWKMVEGVGEVLWTSFVLPMAQVDLVENKQTAEIDHYFVLPGENPVTVVFLKADEGKKFTHEKPFLRTPKGAFRASPRGDGTTHYIEEKSEGMIAHQGPDVREKAEMFTRGYLRYVMDFCTFTS